jgi:predicted transcriptional regulator
MSDKEAALEAIRKLPETVTLEEISEDVAILAALRRAKAASEAAQVVSHEEAKKRLTSWTTR